MATFKAYLKKEIIEASRHYRYVVLAVGILVFAILDPVMLKLLPVILKNQIPVDMASLFKITPKYSVLNYIKDLTQIGYMFVVFSISGALSEEITSKKLMFPYSMGGKPWGIVLSKLLHYIFVVCILTLLGFLTVYYYAGLLFKGESTGINGVFTAAILIGLYYIFNITLTIFFSSFFKKGIGAAFTTILINFIQIPFISFKGVGKYLPYTLVERANAFTMENTSGTIIFTLAACMVLTYLTVKRMDRVEVI